MRKKLHCSQVGLEELDRYRQKQDWSKYDDDWYIAAHVSRATLRRVWSRTPVVAESFIAIVEAVGVRDWRTVAEPDRDFSQAPEPVEFFGREADRQQLKLLIQQETRAIALLGMGGLGKTALALKVARDDVADSFELALWCSLREAPPLLELLDTTIQRLDEMSGKRSDAASRYDEATALDYLFEHHLSKVRCLLVLDNGESLLQPQKLVGEFRPGYEAYADFFERIARQKHRSCVLFTSRELPAVFDRLSFDCPVASIPLQGLQSDARPILRSYNAIGSEAECDRLIADYRGNPKALQIVSSYIGLVFDNSIADFFASAPVMGTLPDFQQLLDEHCQRLSDAERHILDWLAIEREPVTLEQLQENLTLRANSLHAVAQLHSKSLIERVQDKRTYTLQNAIAEYVLERLVARFADILCRNPDRVDDLSEQLLTTHALLKAEAPRYVRQSQERAIAQPLLDTLLVRFGDRDAVIHHLKRWLERLRVLNLPQESYAAGNLINLLRLLEFSWADFDLSGLTIRQVYWCESTLSDLNLRHSHLQDCAFPQAVDSILCLTLSPDDRWMAIGDSSGTLRLWELQTGKLVSVDTAAHSSWIRCLAFSPDGQYLASGSSDTTIRIWKLSETLNATPRPSLEFCQSLEGHQQQIWSIAWIPGKPYLVSASDDGTLRVWDYRSARTERILTGHTGLVRFVGAEPDGCHVVSAAMPSQEVWRWNVETGETSHRWQQTDHQARSIALSPNGHYLATGSDDGDCAVRVYDLRDGMDVPVQMLRGHTNRVWSVVFSADSRCVASGGSDRTAIVWDVETGDRLRTLVEDVGRVRVLAFANRQPHLAAGSDDRGVALWNYAVGKTIRVLQGCTYRVWALCTQSGGQLLSGGDDGTIRLWKSDSDRPVRTSIGHQARIRHLSVSTAGLLASVGNDCTVRLWDFKDGRSLRVLRGHRDWVWFAEFLNDRQLLTVSDDRTLKVWDVEAGRCLKTFAFGKSWIWSMVWCNHNQRAILATEQQGIQVVELPDVSGEQPLPPPVLQLDAGNVRAVALIQDGQKLISGDDAGVLQLWDLSSGHCLQTFQRDRDSRIRTLCIDPTGRWLACGGDGTDIELLDLSGEHRDFLLSGHTKTVWAVAFDHSGQELVSTGEDETIRVWKLNVKPNAEGKLATAYRTLSPPRLCQSLDITHTTGLTAAQSFNLCQLGAVRSAKP